MTIAAINCPKCGVQNIHTSQFCGGCGNPLSPVPTSPVKQTQATPGQTTSGQTTTTSENDWHEKAGLICGLLSIFACGILAAIPGLYFSWSGMKIAKQQGRGTGLATTGMVLNGIGILVTIAGIGIMLMLVVMSAAAGPADPMMDFNSMQGF